MDNLFFYASKLLWMVASPDSVFVILSLVAAFSFYLGYLRITRLILTGLLVSVLLLSFFPVGGWMMFPLEARFENNPTLPERVDGIIVLGGAVKPRLSQAWEQLELNDYAERITSLIDFSARYPDARLVFTGGDSGIEHTGRTEAATLSHHVHSLGVDPGRIEFESRSRNTAENAAFTRELIGPVSGENWILVTSAFHMPRSIGVFCKLGLSVIPFPVDHYTRRESLTNVGFALLSNANGLKLAMHEWLGLLAYYLSGRTDQLLPVKC